MLGSQPRRLPQRLAFVLVPRFSMIAFTGAVESLRLANRAAGKQLYDWKLYSVDGKPVTCSNGIALHPNAPIDLVNEADAVVVCSGIDVQLFDDKRLASWLRAMDRKGADIGALCTGSHILARAGLLDGYHCTIHWENLAGFAEDFPDLEVTPELFEIDRNRFTCSGGTAAIDMMLNVISLQHGYELAAQVADQFMHERIRDRHDQQRMSLRPGSACAIPSCSRSSRSWRRTWRSRWAAASWPSTPGSRRASSSGCSASTSTARRRATTWSSGSTARACCCCRPT